MTKRLVEIDDELLERARASAGTRTVKATVQAGLRRLADQDLSVQHVRRLRRRGALDPKALRDARAPRAGRGS